jgi:hypothetical protein
MIVDIIKDILEEDELLDGLEEYVGPLCEIADPRYIMINYPEMVRLIASKFQPNKTNANINKSHQSLPGHTHNGFTKFNGASNL